MWITRSVPIKMCICTEYITFLCHIKEGGWRTSFGLVCSYKSSLKRSNHCSAGNGLCFLSHAAVPSQAGSFMETYVTQHSQHSVSSATATLTQLKKCLSHHSTSSIVWKIAFLCRDIEGWGGTKTPFQKTVLYSIYCLYGIPLQTLP